jgi:nickel-dependent lactate racemase
VIICAGECIDGHGGEDFYHDFIDHTPSELLEIFASRGRTETARDQWQSQILAQIMEKCTVILVSSLSRDFVEKMGLKWAPDLQSAI